MSNNTTFPKRHTTLGKRLDMSDHQCTTSCEVVINEYNPDPDACASLYKGIQSMPGTLTLGPCTSPSLPQDNDTKLTDTRDSGLLG